MSKRELEEIHSVSFLVLFRLLFIAYGEDRGLLPYNTNEIYKKYSLKALAKNIAELVEVTPFHLTRSLQVFGTTLLTCLTIFTLAIQLGVFCPIKMKYFKKSRLIFQPK